MRLAANGDAMHAERKARLHLGKRRVGALAAGQAVGENADLMAAFDLSLREIEDMAEDAADRRAHGVQNSQRIGRNGSHLSKDFQDRFCRGSDGARTARPPCIGKIHSGLTVCLVNKR